MQRIGAEAKATMATDTNKAQLDLQKQEHAQQRYGLASLAGVIPTRTP
jgi:hypothetical protein